MEGRALGFALEGVEGLGLHEIWDLQVKEHRFIGDPRAQWRDSVSPWKQGFSALWRWQWYGQGHNSVEEALLKLHFQPQIFGNTSILRQHPTLNPKPKIL